MCSRLFKFCLFLLVGLLPTSHSLSLSLSHGQVLATPHHEFPTCGGPLQIAANLKAGDCVKTNTGSRRAIVAHAVLTKPRPGEETYVLLALPTELYIHLCCALAT